MGKLKTLLLLSVMRASICTKIGQNAMRKTRRTVNITENITENIMERFKQQRRQTSRLQAFTLVEILIVIALIAIVAALGIGYTGSARAQARHVQCDSKLKAVALALDAFRQENQRYPAQLSQLVTRKYLQRPAALRCPSDRRAEGSYASGYVLRAPREATAMGEVPLVLCPLHEAERGGAQVYNARYTRQFATSPAVLSAANATFITHPDGSEELQATQGMELHGGDRIRTQGGALITFVDGTTCDLKPGSDLTVLQSFMEGSGSAPLYSLVRQNLGEIWYRVHHGSKFDVATATATAGARGTEFWIKVAPDGNATVHLISDSKLYVSTTRTTGRATPGQDVTIVGGVLGGAVTLLKGLGGLLDGLF